MKKKKSKFDKQKIKQSALNGRSVKRFVQDVLPIIKYVGCFIILVTVFYHGYSSAWFERLFIGPLVGFQVEVVSYVLNLFGQDTYVNSSAVASDCIWLNLSKGCDGLEPLALFLFGVLLVPFHWRAKLTGLLWGIVALFFLNLVRIILLYFSKAYFPITFDFLHLHGGFGIFTGLTFIIWINWAKWAILQQRLKKVIDNGQANL